jgi:Cu/Ag efflux protein CusF
VTSTRTTVATLRALFVITSLVAAIAVPARARAENPSNIYPFAAGTIQTIDKSSKVVTLATAKGPLTVALTDRTYIYRGKEKWAADKLQVGDLVKINYYTNDTGKAFVRRLKVGQVDPPAETPAP